MNGTMHGRLLVSGVAVACQTSSLRSEPEGFDHGTGQFVRPGGPHPLTCLADGDCVSGPLVNPDNGCCDTGVHLAVFSRDYLHWRAEWVRANCAGVHCRCSPPPVHRVRALSKDVALPAGAETPANQRPGSVAEAGDTRARSTTRSPERAGPENGRPGSRWTGLRLWGWTI